MKQLAPDPEPLRRLVAKLTYRPGWAFRLVDDFPRDEDPDGNVIGRGMTLVITTKGYDFYHPEQGENYRVNHYMIVPAATYDMRSWRRWLFEQCLLVDRHEACEAFRIDGEPPYAPHHGPGNDPYIVFEHGTDEDVRTRFTGEVLEPK